MPTREWEPELRELLDKDEDELFLMLAQSDPAYGDVMFSPGEARELGRRRFQQLQEPLRRKVCEEWDYCSKRTTGDFADSLTLTAAVADVIVTVLGGIPAGTVATLLVKRGLTGFCGCRGRD